MDAQTFVDGLFPLRGSATERYIAEHASQVDDLDVAANLLKDAAQAQETQDLELSEVLANQLLAVAHWTASPRHYGLAWLALGNVRMRPGRHREAIAYFDAAGAMFQAAGDEVGWARTRISYLWSATNVGLTEGALKQAEQARQVLLAHQEERRAGALDIAIGLAYLNTGRYPEALAVLHRALSTYQPDTPKEAALHRANVLVNKSLVLEMMGDFPGMIATAQEARAILVEQKEFLRVAEIDHNLAVGRASLGEYSAALHLYYQALEQFQNRPELRNWEALCRANMADCLLRLNRAAEALIQAKEAAAIYRSLNETSNFAWTLIYLAWAQLACNQMPETLRTLAEARQLFLEIGAIATTGLVSLTQAQALLVAHDTAQALASVEEAQAIFQHYQMKRWEIEAILLTGRICEAAGDFARAAFLAEQACLAARDTKLPWLEFGCEALLGRLAQRQNDAAAAEQHFLAALNLLEGLMNWLVRDQRSTFLTDKEPVFNALISLALLRQDTSSALEFLERLRSQVLREYLTRSSEIRLRASEPGEEPFLTKLQQLRQELQGYTGQITAIEKYIQETSLAGQELAYRGGANSSALVPSPHQAILQDLQNRQHRCEQEISQLLERAFLQRESSRFDPLPKPGAAHQGAGAEQHPLVGRLSALLPQDSTLLEYFFQDNDLLIFTLHPQQQQAEVTRVAGVVARLTQELLPLFRANIDMAGQLLLTHPEHANLHATLETTIQGWSRQLYDILLQPVEAHLPRGGRLMIVPYGPLHLLPFHALFGPQGYLIERCEVSYLPAASMFLLQASSAVTRRNNQQSHKSALVLGHSSGGKLKHIAREAEAVAKLLGTHAYLEEQATIDQLQRAGEGCSIIHLAAHGKNRAEAPDFSYLQLADARLSVVDVFNLDLSAELVTLSGCETGLVVIGGGDELLGLARGFLYAGARSLLISLWNVEDESTAELMGQFYQGLLAGRSRAAALRAAQSLLLEAARTGKRPASWAHPYFWAPFRLLGDAGPIYF